MSYAYFAITDEQIRKSRSIARSPSPPKCTSENCNYFVRNGLYFTKYDSQQVIHVLAEKLKDTEIDFIELRFENQKLLREAVFFLCENGGVNEAFREAGREKLHYLYSTKDDLCLLKIEFDT